MTAETVEVGASFWMYDHTQEYRQGGRKYYQVKVIGETRVSWLCSPEWSPIKIPKRDTSRLMADIEKQQHEWCRGNASRIAQKVTREIPYDDLQKIAVILGYSETT